MESHRHNDTPHANDGPSLPTTDRLAALLQELRTLLDASRRSLDHAKGTLAEHAAAITSGGAAHVEEDLSATAQRLERMADLVHAAMQNASRPIGSPSLSRSRPVTLGEAVRHAADVLAPLALRHDVRISLEIAPTLDLLPAGALYTVVLNALQNAIEACGARTRGGLVHVSLKTSPPPSGTGYGRDTRTWCVLEVSDDGIGPPSNPSRCFDLGFTTKRHGAGVGLAVARSVVQGMGGTIELVPRGNAPGATLRVRFPAASATPAVTLGEHS
jgi:signal transduction histidine kinase